MRLVWSQCLPLQFISISVRLWNLLKWSSSSSNTQMSSDTHHSFMSWVQILHSVHGYTAFFCHVRTMILPVKFTHFLPQILLLTKHTMVNKPADMLFTCSTRWETIYHELSLFLLHTLSFSPSGCKSLWWGVSHMGSPPFSTILCVHHKLQLLQITLDDSIFSSLSTALSTDICL